MWREVCAKIGTHSDAEVAASVRQAHCVSHNYANHDAANVARHSYLCSVLLFLSVMNGAAIAPETCLWSVSETVS